ncbi:long-chain-fatty-acid--ligase 5 [Stylonychia lemnae]|uniref:Long-chain-fatty-acid--ligase 5 n=1 Tax=Stylonychia lemnae TaxID=5949 RepID=A0A078AHN7_STYLE|nr:long-chain-fatty-acid--ligase 5 [Stylonychia lemnae]|eukprot:CDW81371.1 long-chain-fatty-acid--ligase 5 [Stylonychia lemnae]
MGINQSKEDFKYSCYNPNQPFKPLTSTKEIIEPVKGHTTIWQYFQRSVKLHKNSNYLGRLKPEEKSISMHYEWKTFGQVNEDVYNLIKGFQKHQICDGSIKSPEGFTFIGIYSENRFDWIITELAAIRMNLVIIPVFYRYFSASIEQIINSTQLDTICVSSHTIQTIIDLQLEGRIPSLQTLISFDDPTFEQFQQLLETGLSLYTFNKLILDGMDQADRIQEIPEPTKDSVFIIAYTSGTTGEPKGAILTHQNIICGNSKPEFYGFDFSHEDVNLSYVPLSHIYEQILLVSNLIHGYSTGFSSGNVSKLMLDIQKLQPTIFGSFPTFYNNFYKTNLAKLNIKSNEVKYMSNEKKQIIKNQFGGRIRCFISGGAPLSQEVFDFLQTCFECPVFEAYGITELAGALCSTVSFETQAGLSGGPLPCLKVKISDIKELNYMSTDDPPRGELRVKGDSVFKAYFRNEKLSKEAFDEDGWFRTGDVVSYLPNGSIKVIDRVKNICKTQKGFYVAPNYLEAIYSQSQLIKQIFVSVQPHYEAVVAIINPDRDALLKKAEEMGINDDIQYQPEDVIYRDQAIRELIVNELKQKADQFGFQDYERIENRFLLISQEFHELGIMNTSMKMMRHQAEVKLKPMLDKIFKHYVDQ